MYCARESVVEGSGRQVDKPLKLQESDTLGTELVQALAEKLKAAIVFDNDQGAKVTLKVPACSLRKHKVNPE